MVIALEQYNRSVCSSVIVLLMARKLVFVVSEEDICSLTQPEIKTSLYIQVISTPGFCLNTER